MDKYSTSFVIKTTQVTETTVTLSHIWDKTKQKESTVNNLRKYRHHTKVNKLISHKIDQNTKLIGSKLCTMSSEEDTKEETNNIEGYKEEISEESNSPEHKHPTFSRVSVICANKPALHISNADMDIDQEEDDRDEQIKTKNVKEMTPCGQSQAVSSSNTIQCPICSEVTIDHLHYGGLACFSCKAFFRRTVNTVAKKSKRCRRGDGKCPLKLGKRNNCPACRFQKCLNSGMSPSLVLSGKTEGNKFGGKKRLISCKSNEVIASLESDVKNDKIVASATLTLTEEDKLSQILHHHRLVISQTAGVNLLTVPAQFLSHLEERIQVERPTSVNPDLLCLAQLELAFLKAKDSVKFFTDNFSRDQILERVCPALIFTSVQELFVQLVIFFLKNCQHFQSLTWPCQARLLRKNIADVSVIMMMMCFEKNLQVFRWRLGSKDIEDIKQMNNIIEPVIHIDKTTLSKYLNDSIGNDIFEAINTLSQLEIPGHILLILILICMYTRDGMLMEKQHRVDLARAHYQQLLFRYIKETNPEDQCSRLMVTLNRALKSVKDFAEKVRSYQVVSVRQA